MAAKPPFTPGENPTAAKLNRGVYVYDVSTAAVDVASSVTETSLYAATITAGHMSSDRLVRVTLVGDYLNNTGGVADLTLRVKWAGTTVYQDLINGIDQNANRRPLVIEGFLPNLGAANSQFLAGVITIGGAGATTGIGNLDFLTNQSGTGTEQTHASFGSAGTLAVDTAAADRVFEITVQHGAASASISVRKHYAMLEMCG